MNIKILLKLFTVLFLTLLPLQLSALTIVNLAACGTLLTAGGITGIKAKETWTGLKTDEVVTEASSMAKSSIAVVKAFINNDRRNLDKHMYEFKNAAVRLKDKAGPTTCWSAATVICVGFGLRLFLQCL